MLWPGAEAGSGDLEGFCRRAPAPFKRPKRFIFVEALPKNASGKVLKRELKERISSAAAP